MKHRAASLHSAASCLLPTIATTLRPKKVSHWIFDHNFGKCGRIFKILSPGGSQENSLCMHRKDFHLTCNMLLHYLVKFKNLKMLPNVLVEDDKHLISLTKISH